MKPFTQPDHHAHAEALRRKVLEGPGLTSPTVRQTAAASAAGRSVVSTQAESGDLARQIGEAAALVTDAQVDRVLAALGSEKATFEIIMAAAVGAGLLRWQEGVRALEAATHETG